MADSVAQTLNRKGTGRSGLIYAVLTLALLAAMIPALHPPQPPVPPTAAYAPEAAQNPQQAPNNQGSSFGKGANGQGSNGAPKGGTTPTPAPTANPAAGSCTAGCVPRYLDCVNGPGGPRQVLDTQSAPCIASWTGNNGGATSPGVTADAIKVYAPDYTDGSDDHELTNYVQWINDHFELYGRKLVVTEGGCASADDTPQTTLKTNADKIANEGFFASTDYCDRGGEERFYYDELARRGVISVALRPDTRFESDYASAHPPGGGPYYEWNYLPSFDAEQRDLAALACRQLAHTNAPAYAGGGARKFGVIYSIYDWDNSPPDLSVLTDGLHACGATFDSSKDVYGVHYVVGTESTGYQPYDSQSAQDAQNAAANFKLDGVTAVISVAHSEDTLETMVGADNVGAYHPEWLMSNYLYNNSEPLQPNPPADQWQDAFGFDYENRLEPPQDSTWYWPLAEELGGSYNSMYAPERYYGNIYQYPYLLLLADALQMAGPDLTPQTFAQGLWNTHFPNPPSPYAEGKVGFDNDHTFVKDVTLEWYSPSTPGPWGGQQATWCFVNGGQRYKTVSSSANGADPALPSNFYPYNQGLCDP